VFAQLQKIRQDSIMNRASFRFFAELNDFLNMDQRHNRFWHRFLGRPGVNDVIEALGPPHTEVDLILVNGSSVGFDYSLQAGDYVSIYPRFRTLNISSITKVRPAELAVPRFVLDTHLGRLAGYLRMLGFDSQYSNQIGDERLAQISHDQERILLTRDRGLLKRNAVTHGYCVRQTNPRAQMMEVVHRFQLEDAVQPFKRCIRCNGILETVSKEAIIERLPQAVREGHDHFRMCSDCDRVYWRGSHFERMQQLVSIAINWRDSSGPEKPG
jgi:uncharacterized protein with PIN domain